MIFSTVLGPHEPALTVGSLAMTATGRPAIVPEPGDDAVGAEPVALPVGQQRVLDERAVVEQPRDALAHGQLALLARLVAVALGAAAERAVERLLQVAHCSLLISKTCAASPRVGRGRERPARAQADGQQPAGADGQHQRPADQRRLAAGRHQRGDRRAPRRRSSRGRARGRRPSRRTARSRRRRGTAPSRCRRPDRGRDEPTIGPGRRSAASASAVRPARVGEGDGAGAMTVAAGDGGRTPAPPRARAAASGTPATAVGREDQVDEAQRGEHEAHGPEQRAQRGVARGREPEAERRQRAAGPGQRAARVAGRRSRAAPPAARASGSRATNVDDEERALVGARRVALPRRAQRQRGDEGQRRAAHTKWTPVAPRVVEAHLEQRDERHQRRPRRPRRRRLDAAPGAACG